MESSIRTDKKTSIGRICTKCEVFKNWGDFYVQKGGKFGKRSSCKICDREQNPKTVEMMSWENYGRGKGKWNIDHIKELHTFDLSDRIQFLRACHVTNLQPIWWDQNTQKSMKIRKLEKECN